MTWYSRLRWELRAWWRGWVRPRCLCLDPELAEWPCPVHRRPLTEQPASDDRTR